MVVTPLLKRRATIVAPLPLADRGGEHVGDEEADGLRLLMLVGAYGAFVAVLPNRAEIVLAHANRAVADVRGAPAPAGLLFARLRSP
jgi:hypothetical protein